MCPLIIGTESVRQRDYRVYIAATVDHIASIAGAYAAMIGATDPYEQKENLDLVLVEMEHIGEMRRDSIELGLEEGETIEGNEVGKIVMSKAGSFSCELINAITGNIDILNTYDGKETLIALEEIDNSRVGVFNGAHLEAHEIILIGNVSAILAGATSNVGYALSVGEKHTGSGLTVTPLNLARSVGSAGDFRKIIDIGYDVLEAPVIDSVTAGGPGEIVVYLVEAVEGAGDYYCEVSLADDFAEIAAEEYTSILAPFSVVGLHEGVSVPSSKINPDYTTTQPNYCGFPGLV